MTSVPFDALGYFEKLKEAGVPEAQAKVQAEAWRAQAEAQAQALREQNEAQARALQEQKEALQKAFSKHDADTRKELATKGDVRETELRLQKEIEKVRAEIEKVRAEIKHTEVRLIKYQIAGWVALGAIMAKGFGWIGF